MSIGKVWEDWQVIDKLEVDLSSIELLSHQRFSTKWGEAVECVAVPAWVPSPLRNLFLALLMLVRAKKNTTVIVNGGEPLWIYVGVLNAFLFGSRKNVLCWDVFVESESGWKQWFFRKAMKGINLSLLWSKQQVATHAEFLQLSDKRFIFLPFKSNHSKNTHFKVEPANFIFSGGNGKRDYRTLCDAVSGLDMPVLISATDPSVRKDISSGANVIPLAAEEPSFAKLQAASRIVIIPMVSTGLKGGGEANFCNAMWHGRPVIAVDDIAAVDYIDDGVTGYIVPSGDAVVLRDRILALWNDPELCQKMGEHGRRKAEEMFTHNDFIRRLVVLSAMVSIEQWKPEEL